MSLRILWILMTVLSVLTAVGPVRKLKAPGWFRILLGFFFISASQGYVLQKLFDASVMCPDKLPFWLLVPAKWGDIITLATGCATLLWWGLRLVRVKVAALAPLLVGVVLGTWMLYMGERQPPVRERLFEVPHLPAEAEGLRVAVIADLHIDCWRSRAWCERFVARVNATNPHLILFTGDQVDGEFERRIEDLAPLATLQAPLGKYLISGNHEYFFDAANYLRYYDRLGLKVLDGKTETVRGVTLLGLPDSLSLTNYENASILETMMANVPQTACTLLLAHKPGIAPLADVLGVDAQLSGHTHGGQFPGLAFLMKRFNAGFVRGYYTLPNGLHLFVAPGSAAWIGFPYRLYSSEISVLTLTRANP